MFAKAKLKCSDTSSLFVCFFFCILLLSATELTVSDEENYDFIVISLIQIMCTIRFAFI